MSEKFDAELLSKFLDQLQKMIDLREEMIKWLQDFIEEVKTQERGVNGAKTGGAVLGVVSFFGLFTPVPPLALAGLVVAEATGVATTIVDFIANKVKGGNLKVKVEEMKAEDSELEKLQKELNAQAEILAQVIKIMLP